MPIDFQTLPPEQAQRAALALFDSLPPDLFPGGGKPTAARIGNVLDDIDDLPENIQASVDRIRAAKEPAIQADLARSILSDLHRNPQFRESVERAVDSAAKPHMSPIPMDIGMILLFIGILSMKFSSTSSTSTEKVSEPGKTTIQTNRTFEFSPREAIDPLVKLINSVPKLFHP